MEVIEKTKPIINILEHYAQRFTINGVALTRKKAIPATGKPRNYLKARLLLNKIETNMADEFIMDKKGDWV